MSRERARRTSVVNSSCMAGCSFASAAITTAPWSSFSGNNSQDRASRAVHRASGNSRPGPSPRVFSAIDRPRLRGWHVNCSPPTTTPEAPIRPGLAAAGGVCQRTGSRPVTCQASTIAKTDARRHEGFQAYQCLHRHRRVRRQRLQILPKFLSAILHTRRLARPSLLIHRHKHRVPPVCVTTECGLMRCSASFFKANGGSILPAALQRSSDIESRHFEIRIPR